MEHKIKLNRTKHSAFSFMKNTMVYYAWYFHHKAEMTEFKMTE